MLVCVHCEGPDIFSDGGLGRFWCNHCEVETTAVEAVGEGEKVEEEKKEPREWECLREDAAVRAESIASATPDQCVWMRETDPWHLSSRASWAERRGWDNKDRGWFFVSDTLMDAYVVWVNLMTEKSADQDTMRALIDEIRFSVQPGTEEYLRRLGS